MRVYYDKVKTQEVNDKIWETWGENKKKFAETGYNVSECSGCELKCYCNRIGQEQKVTRRSIGFLVFGIIAETIVMKIYSEEEKQFEANLNGLVWGHMDAYEDFTYAIEGKATAKRIFKAEHLPIQWIMQLTNYITMSKSNKGWLYILDIWSRTMSAFCVELSATDKLMQIEVLMDKVSRFDYAIKTRYISDLKISPKDYENCFYKTTCPRRKDCKEQHKQLVKAKKKK